MEVIVKDRLEYLTESPQHPEVRRFNSRQGGFPKGRGPEEQLYSVVSALYSARNRLQFTCLLSFDLANAFDTVDHGKLMDILQRRGVPAKFLRWIEAFLRTGESRLTRPVCIEEFYFVLKFLRRLRNCRHKDLNAKSRATAFVCTLI
ncbi:hypothetical protein DIPPA_13888 [Diplonema papillatum]|nr:hypothetical protein DIPPA_13888 [Diplonema papillatum]